MSGVIELRGVHKSYPDGPHVLRGVDLRLDAGDFLAVTGPSGSGKTTLLNLLGLLDAPDQGEVLFDGETLPPGDRNRRTALRKHRIGFIFQHPILFPKRSVLENVLFRARYLNRPRPSWVPKARECLRRLGLDSLSERPAGTLSGGEAQRVAIARALLVSPHLLLADEPTGNLDDENAAEVMRALSDAAEQGIAVLLVTHNLSWLQQVRRHLVCREGRLMESGLGNCNPGRTG